MNEILQKRIIEAARKEREQCREDNNEIWRGNPTYNDVEASFTKGANFALQNQWISVEEALPEEDIPNCFVAYKTFDKVFYSTGIYEKDNDEWYVDGVGFNVEVTHYMPIPSLKGGEK